MLVYRLEHTSGIGPYHCSGLIGILSPEQWEELDKLSYKLCDTHSGSPNHPVPNFYFCHERSCACESLDKLCEWFDGFLEKYAKLGYIIAIYDVLDDIKIDFNQVSFKKDFALLVETISII